MKSVNTYLICNSLSTLGTGAAQFCSVTEMAPKRNHCSYLWTEALYPVWFSRRSKSISGINSNVDIEAKLTPSAGQEESDAVTVLRANAPEFMSFGHSIPIYSHFKTNFTALKRLFHTDAHGNHVELFPAASRWMISCLAAVGVFMTCWSRLRSQFVVGLYQLCIHLFFLVDFRL